MTDFGFRRAVEAGNVELVELLAKNGKKPSSKSIGDLRALAETKHHHATAGFLRSIS